MMPSCGSGPLEWWSDTCLHPLGPEDLLALIPLQERLGLQREVATASVCTASVYSGIFPPGLNWD